MLHTSSFLMHQLSHVQVLAAATDQSDVKPYGGAVVFGVIFVIMGGLAFSGKWRSWSTSYVLRIYRFAPLALGWGGIGLLVGALGSVLPEPMAEIVGFPGIVFFLLCLVGMVWLPRFMLPRWYRVQKGLEPREHAGARAMSARGSLASSADDRVGAVPSVDSSEGVSFAAGIGGSIGGVGAVGRGRPSDGDEASSSEGGPGASGPAGSAPA